MSERERRAFVRWAAPIMLLAQLLREHKGDPKRAIAWAESLWEALVAAGYGPGVRRDAIGPRADPKRDHVAALPSELAESYERLWRAYAHPHGKQGAAERWAQLAPDAELTARIIAAAAAEAREPRPEGAARKWLQGWLSERRWEDRPVPAGAGSATEQDAIAARRLAMAELLGEHKRLVLHCRHYPEDAQARAELARLGEQLAGFGIAPGLTTPKPARPGARPLKALLVGAPRRGAPTVEPLETTDGK